ncbi:hypothetical protein H2268_06265, partial [Campylobacter sp. RM12910]|nr:hypothetical protein [Campylobacter sp. RM12910]
EKFGKSKIERLLNRQKNSTSGFFWTKEELDQRYLSESLQHFEKIGAIFKQVSNQDFFAELDHAIDRKFKIFQDMINVEEKAIRLSGEHIKQTMGELSRAQRDQRDLGKLYSEMLNGIGMLNQNLKEVNMRMSEQYNRLLDISNEKIQHFDKTLGIFTDEVERFSHNFKLYEQEMLQSQEKIFEGFKTSLFEGMHKFKEIYEEEKNIDEKIKMMGEFKKEIQDLNEETNEMIKKIGKEVEEQEANVNKNKNIEESDFTQENEQEKEVDLEKTSKENQS